jgi:hypothetical protein
VEKDINHHVVNLLQYLLKAFLQVVEAVVVIAMTMMMKNALSL